MPPGPSPRVASTVAGSPRPRRGSARSRRPASGGRTRRHDRRRTPGGCGSRPAPGSRRRGGRRPRRARCGAPRSSGGPTARCVRHDRDRRRREHLDPAEVAPAERGPAPAGRAAAARLTSRKEGPARLGSTIGGDHPARERRGGIRAQPLDHLPPARPRSSSGSSRRPGSRPGCAACPRSSRRRCSPGCPRCAPRRPPPHQPASADLDDDVARRARERPLGRRRADVDDRPAPGRAHRGKRGSGHVVGRVEVDRHLRAPHVHRRLVDRAGRSKPPAILASASTPPNRSTAAATTASADAGSVRSASTASTPAGRSPGASPRWVDGHVPALFAEPVEHRPPPAARDPGQHRGAHGCSSIGSRTPRSWAVAIASS